MGISAAATALTAYLLGTMTNEAVVNHNYRGIVVIGIIAMVIFAAKGFATYGGAVTLSWVGNRIIADNQRRMFDKLLQQDIGFFADRHSSEFIARLTTGANAVSAVINLLITAIGRDLMSLIGLTIVMVVQDPMMSLIGFIVAPPALLLPAQAHPPGARHRPHAVHRRHAHHRDHAGGPAGHAHGQGLRVSKTRCGGGSARASARSSTNPTRWRASPTAPARSWKCSAASPSRWRTIYGGYRVIETGATPGEFVSFIAAFLLAYEPAKRLARLNIDLNNNLVGVRVLYEVIDSPAGEPNDDDLPPTCS